MFGPDICGTKRSSHATWHHSTVLSDSASGIHAILNYNGNNLEWKKTVAPETDALTHVYGLAAFERGGRREREG